MKNHLLALVGEAVDLLTDCGWQKEAAWFAEVAETLRTTRDHSSAFVACLRRLDRVLAGMGSFTDIPLESKSGKMTDQEARSLQWRLAADIGDTIEKMLANEEPPPANGKDA